MFVNAFIDSQFNYAQLICMLCRKEVFENAEDSSQNTEGNLSI